MGLPSSRVGMWFRMCGTRGSGMLLLQRVGVPGSVRCEDLQEAMRRPRRNAPGPDGLTSAWAATGELGEDVLWRVMQEMRRGGEVPP